MKEYLLEMRGITKRFSGVKALDDVNLKVEKGEIHGIVGENGAGKSTLMNILSGVYPYGDYEGDIVYGDEICKFSGIKDSEKKGIVIIHQELALVPQFTISENIFLGNEVKEHGVINWDKTHKKAAELLERVGLNESPLTLVQNLSVGKMQLVEIAKAISKNVNLLILDEPTAALNDEDSMHLLNLMLRFKKEGMTSIIISHKLGEVEYVSDHITVIRDGRTIETLAKGTGEISEHRIVHSMVGREMSDRFPKRQSCPGDVKFEVKNWTVFHPQQNRKVIDDVSFYVRKGEVVGISGLMGAGRTELAMSIFGRLYGRAITGEMYMDGELINMKTVGQALRHKMAYVTEDRKSCGLILSQSIGFNTTLANLKRISNHQIINHDVENSEAEEYRKMLGVKSDGIAQLAESLSGGNQQKVLLSKWMFTDPEVLVLDEPTRGIDVGAKYEIYEFIGRLAAEGKAVVMISSELQELLGVCDRIYVLNEGRILADLPIEEASQERIMEIIVHDSGIRGE